jgi:hypothetical protein
VTPTPAPTTAVPRSLHALLDHIVDYAGLFPPARLDLRSAVHEYAAYRAGEHRWALGRFVIPAPRLEELAREVHGLAAPDEAPWQLSALVAPLEASEGALVAAFNERQGAAGEKLGVDAIETRAATPADVDAVLDAVPSSIATYVEVPLGTDPRPLLDRIAKRNARAKARTGGVTAEAFPTPAQVARFLAACIEIGLPFKATAGLHHPLRGEYALTYEPESPRGVMFGFLNVFLAAAALRGGASERDAEALLTVAAPDMPAFGDDGVSWGGLFIPTDELRASRARSAIAFGSCSFREPITDLSALGLL